MLKLKMMVAMMLPLVIAGCIIKAARQSVREATTASGVDNAASTGRHRRNGIISPEREADHYANNWKEPRSILMSSADRVAHIDGQLM